MSKDRPSKHQVPDFVARAREEARVKLDALLGTVEVRRRNAHDRLPRKVGEVVSDTGIRDGYRTKNATYTLRLDAKSGQFMVEHGDMLYVARTREALQAKMDEVSRITLALEWTRYISISYSAVTKHAARWSRNELGVADRRGKKTRIRGLSLSWEVVEYTGEFQIPGQKPCRMKRAIDEAGLPSSEELETVDCLPDGLVAYSPERMAVLSSVLDVFTAIDARMIELLRGSSARVAAQIDAAAGRRFLSAATGSDPEVSE